MIYGYFWTWNSKIEAILQSDYMLANDRKGSCQPRVIERQIGDWFVRIKMCVSYTFCSHDSKNVIFISVRWLEMLNIAIWKNDVIYGYGFWAICLPKIDISTWKLACQISRHGSTTKFSLFENLFFRLYKKNSVLYFLDYFLSKFRDGRFEELFILRLLFLFICILLKISFFGGFSNIY